MTEEVIRDNILDTKEMKKLIVRGIPKDAKVEEVKEFFETHSGGAVESVDIVRKESHTSKKSFGFVTFAESELIDNLLLKRAELTFKGKTLRMNRFVSKTNTTLGALDRTKKLFISNVPKEGVSEDDLLKYFKARHPEKFGTIEKVILKKEKHGKKKNKGFGFVTVSSEDMADKMAIQHAHFELGGRKIELKKFSPPEGGGRGGRGGQGGRGGRGAGQFAGGYGGYGGGFVDYFGGYGGGFVGYGGFGGGFGTDYGYGGYGGGFGPEFGPVGFRGGFGAEFGRGGYRGGHGCYSGGYGLLTPRGRGRGQRYTHY